MRGPGACPRWGATWLLHEVPHWIALPPGQAPGPHPAPHPPLVPTFPHSVVKIHQERSFHATMESLRESYFTSIPQKLQRSGTVMIPISVLRDHSKMREV